MADGRVFATASSPNGPILYAVDAASGALAFHVPIDGVLTAFNPATGAKLWSVQLPG